MRSENKKFITEPMSFLFSDNLLSGGVKAPYDIILLENKDKSLRLSLSQDLPDGYLVWQDLIENSVGEFSLEDNYSEAEDYLEDIDEEYSDLQEEKTLIYRKSKIKKTNTEYDDFYFEILDEVYYQLKMLSIQRYILGYQKKSLLENMFEIYKEGLYPCGMTKDKKIVAFNPMILKTS
ncbi:hypothetical protein Ppb6_00041 [Photorhabdus australis subsp. thailandensis]|uniref:Uncharacterized protein n=1 Tax=Photorhabdus australis subsp. thailandensis TaxID=2805096 RepID=A0A1C0U9R5_9GAMM|nr:hypothetical protein [Photorhabdus australis]OCQ54677.1 hypothetical protein Ppb6_00041 [Photorhabdus australis subsp. thailandensis]